MTLQAIACAKVNLSLRVGGRQDDGLHHLDGIFQSIGWVDELLLNPDNGRDSLGNRVSLQNGYDGPEKVIDGWRNLAWQASWG